MDYRLNTARSLVTHNIRPRLHFGPDDIARIHQGLDTPVGRRIWTAFAKRARALATLALEVDDPVVTLAEWSRSWDRPGTKIVFGLPDIAALAALADDEQAFAACRRILTACAAAEQLSLKDGGRKRLGYMTGAYLAPAYDMIAARLTVAERRAFCSWGVDCSIRQTLKELDPRFFFSPGGNIPVVGLNGAFITALCLHGDPYAKLDDGTLARLTTMLETAVGGSIAPDGYPLEDIGYGTAVTSGLAISVECARRLGVADIAATLPRYHLFGRAILHFVQPWGEHLSNTGDHGDDFRAREFILPRLATDTADPTLLWLWQTLSYNHGAVHPGNSDQTLYGEVSVGSGRQVPPTLATLLHAPLLRQARRPTAKIPTAFCDRRRGIVSFRSGWRADDALLIFDSSQRSDGAQGHHHESAGHFSFSALGEYFSIDTGRYNVAQSCHSVVLVNAAQRKEDDQWRQTTKEGRLTAYAPHPFVDTAAVDSTVQHGVLKAERRAGLVKGPEAPAYAWVADAINANNEMAVFDWQMQCAPESRLRTRRRGATITGFRHGNLLDVDLFLPLFPGNHRSPDAHRITEVFEDVGHPNATAYLHFDDPEEIRKKVAAFSRPAAMIHGPVYERPRLVVRFSGWNGRSLALLIPRRKGEPAPRLTQLDALPGTIAVTIAFATVTDTLILGFDHPMLRADGIDERGGWCVVRRRNSDGHILRHVIGAGI